MTFEMCLQEVIDCVSLCIKIQFIGPFAPGSVYNTSASGAKQTTETNNLNWT